MDISVASAVGAFNDGASGIVIMSKVGLHAGFWNLESSRHMDLNRISGGNYKSIEIVKGSDKDYGAGLH